MRLSEGLSMKPLTPIVRGIPPS